MPQNLFRRWSLIWIALGANMLFVITEVQPISVRAAHAQALPQPDTATRSPKGTILSVLSSTVRKDGSIVIEAQVESPQGGAVELVVTQSGAPIPVQSITQSRALARAAHYTITLTPPRKDGLLSIEARAGGQGVAKADLRLRNGAPEQRPALYVLAIGVSRYRSADIPSLRFAAKDASDLASTLQRQRDLLYREINHRILSDSQATKAQVLAGFQWLAQEVNTDDTAVLFLAGHGTNDPDGMYYFLPADSEADRATMISASELQDALRLIRGRVVLLLDTCHSGNVLGRRSMNRLINELTSENRIVVFAASTGDQVARESPAWKNGAFTKALVEGLRGVADYAEDNQLSVSELETWTSVRVGQLTQGMQTPTLAKPNAAPDYVIAALPVEGILPNPKRQGRRKMLWGAGGIVLGLSIGIGVAVGVAVDYKNNQNVLEPKF
ncbi:MAG: caspase family protein [Myxococcales bacterium]|nr:caspase family protein [Myxococcales bacterium]